MADMNREGISFDEIMSVTRMNAAQRDAVLQCMRLVSPQYSATYRDIDTAHNCKLLHNLTVDSNRHSPAEGILTMNELQDMMHAQIDIETQHALDVKSIAVFAGDPDVRQQAVSSSS